MDERPYFSVVVPTYNRGYIISQMVESLLKQKFKDWELLVVDDGSTDNTEEIIKNYMEKYKNIYYIKLPQNRGTNFAKNVGANKSKGKWIIFQDSDDKFSKNALEEIYKLTQKINTPLLFTSCITEKGRILSNNPEFSGYVSYKEYICEKIKGEYLPTIKGKTFKKYYFPEDINGGEGILWQKIIRDFSKAFFSNKITRIYNDELEDRLSIKKKNYKRLFFIFKEDLSEFYKDYLKFCQRALFVKSLKMIAYFILWKLKNG